MVIASFLFFLLIFVIIGLCSLAKSKHNTTDYLLAGHSVQPWLVALSAVATNNSGYMFIAMIGYTYSTGLPVIWMPIGWVLGDFIVSLFVHEKLRVVTEEQDAHTFGGLLSGWHGTRFTTLRKLIGLVSVLFLGTYAAAQLKAGSKALYVLFDWQLEAGAIIGAIIILLYCFAGGIRASIWTDAAQSFVMIVSMLLMLVVGVNASGGVSAAIAALHEVSPEYMNLFPDDLVFGPYFGPVLLVLGWMGGGFGVIGQPHIMVRFMAIDNPKSIRRARVWYYSWFSTFFLMSFAVGLLARLILPETAAFDAELALPVISQELLPEVLVGLVLAGLFAATMSTADSLVLSCSGSLTRDFIPRIRDSYFLAKGATVFVTLLALGIALWGTDSVFVLVMISWSAMASAFGPLLFVYSTGGKPSERLAIAMLVVGLGTAILWKVAGLSGSVYEILPGVCAGFFVYFLARLFRGGGSVAASNNA